MTEVPIAIPCPYCDPEDNLFMKRMRVRSRDEVSAGRRDDITVAVYRCDRCGRTKDEVFEN